MRKRRDGNGGAPVPDSVVIIQSNKITAVSRKGQGSYPANAWIVKADGKYVLPGLFDTEPLYCNFRNWRKVCGALPMARARLSFATL
jgi:hypothetical protein